MMQTNNTLNSKENSDMTDLNSKTKSMARFALITATALALTGCNRDTAEEVEEVDVADIATAEEMPANAGGDLFEEPLQPNPLAIQSDDVVITVDDEEITHGEIMQGVQMTMMQMSQQMPPEQLQQMAGQIYQNVSDTLVANILLTKAAKSSSLAVNDEELDEEIAAIEETVPEGQTLQEALAENDVDFDEWKSNLREQILVRKLVDEKTADVAAPTAVEVAAFYEENSDSFKTPENVTASHILISFDEEDTDETKKEKKARLQKIQTNLATGEATFEELATEHSDCPSSERGGELGTFERGQMVPEFEEAAFALDIGGISQIVETQFGYHLIKVTDHQQDGMRSLAEVKTQLENYLTSQKKQEALIAYIDELKADADIEYKQQDFDSEAMEEVIGEEIQM
jgi:peptidyl-prolyl cis-trans isomerase C